MYLFFTIFGIIFVGSASTVLNYLYDIFSINKITQFFKPIEKSTWNEINITVLPTLIWACIALPILGSNTNFLIAILLNIFISCSIIYVVKYSIYLTLNKENSFINLIAIYIAVLVGQFVSFMILKIEPVISLNIWISIVGLIILLIAYASSILYKQYKK